MVLGVVGKIGSGKSHFVKYVKDRYSDLNVIEFSCDNIAKELIRDGKTSYKGANILPYEFFTNDKLQENIRKTLHPEVFKFIKEKIDSNKEENKEKNALYIIESALPSELMYEICDKIVYIRTPYEKSYERLKKNRGYSDSQIKLIYDSQKYYEKYYDMADYIIDNDGNKEDFDMHIDEVMNEICFICK